MASFSFANHYRDIAKKYDVNPPSLEWGYPAQFLEFDSTIKAIIYLKEDLADLHKLDDRTYVAEPTEENAKIIQNFSASWDLLSENQIDISAWSYVIIADSNITSQLFYDFLIFLSDQIPVKAYIFGEEGKYFKGYIPAQFPEIPPPPAFTRRILSINQNSQSEIMMSGEIIDQREISKNCLHYFTANFLSLLNYDLVQYRELNMEALINEKKILSNIQGYAQTDTSFLKVRRKQINDKIRLLKVFGRIKIADYANVVIKWSRPPLRDLFKVFSQYNKGLYLSKDFLSESNFGKSYYELYNNQSSEDERNLIGMSLDDKVFFQHAFYIEEPELVPPPPISV